MILRSECDTCSRSQPALAVESLGVLGAVLRLPPHVETLMVLLCMEVCVGEQNLFTGEKVSNGLRWDKCMLRLLGAFPLSSQGKMLHEIVACWRYNTFSCPSCAL